MKIEIECCGFNPALINVITDVPTKLSITKHKIVIESSDKIIQTLTIKRRSIYSNRFCYLNIINPIYYLHQYKLKNDNIYFYDDNFLWLDIILNGKLSSDFKFQLTRKTEHISGSSINIYAITTNSNKTAINIKQHKMPQSQVLRYKHTNIMSQLFYSALILFLIVFRLFVDQENILLYLGALIILLVISGVKIFKYYSSKSIKEVFNKSL